MTVSIEVKDLTKYYGPLKAVNSVSFDIEAGEIFGFLGPNGAGKTTTLRMLTNLTRPSEGAASILGMDTVRDSLAVRSVVGIVPEASNVFFELSTFANLTFTGALYGARKKDIGARADELIKLFGLVDYRKKKSAELSLGFKRRLTIAMSLMHSPRVVFLDEPTSGLDVESARLIRDIVEDLHRDGVTVFVTTHNMEEANQLCHRIAVIDNGALIAVDTPEQLKQASSAAQAVEVAFDMTLSEETREGLSLLPSVGDVLVRGDKYRLLTSDPPRVLWSLYPFMSENGLKPVSLSTFGPSLEDVFVNLTSRSREAGND